jgi:arylesterase/paraoxonase
VGLPPQPGLFNLHGLDVYVDRTSHDGQARATLFIINHMRPPYGQDAERVGADSVVEVFETALGSDTITHVKTVSHDLILTPNSVLALSSSSFYLTNGKAFLLPLLVEHLGSHFGFVPYQITDKRQPG